MWIWIWSHLSSTLPWKHLIFKEVCNCFCKKFKISIGEWSNKPTLVHTLIKFFWKRENAFRRTRVLLGLFCPFWTLTRQRQNTQSLLWSLRRMFNIFNLLQQKLTVSTINRSILPPLSLMPVLLTPPSILSTLLSHPPLNPLRSLQTSLPITGSISMTRFVPFVPGILTRGLAEISLVKLIR